MGHADGSMLYFFLIIMVLYLCGALLYLGFQFFRNHTGTWKRKR